MEAEMQNAAHAKDEIDFQDSVDSLMDSIKNNAIAQAKIYIPKCETCKHAKCEPVIKGDTITEHYCGLSLIDIFPTNKNYCSFHEPKPE